MPAILRILSTVGPVFSAFLKFRQICERLRASSEPLAKEAIDLFVYRIVREIGSLAAALGGLDALVFTGGIGENDAATRAEVVSGCAWLGLTLDEAANRQAATRISARRLTCCSICHPDERRAGNCDAHF